MGRANFLLVVATILLHSEECRGFLSLPLMSGRGGRRSLPRPAGSVRCNLMPIGSSEPPQMGKVPLGSQGLQISELGVGTIAWGDEDRGFQQTQKPILEQAFREMVEAGVNFFDTAEVYGYKRMPMNSSSEVST